MKKSICAAAAIVLTALSFTVFVSGDETLARRLAPVQTASVQIDAATLASVRI